MPGVGTASEITHTPVTFHHEYSRTHNDTSKDQQTTNTTSTQTDISGADIENMQDELDDLRRKLSDKAFLLAELFID